MTAASNSSPHVSPPSSIAGGSSNKSQVITQNIHAKSASSGSIKDQQSESLVVSVPLSVSVPGIQLPTNSSNNNTSNNSIVSTIVTNQAQIQTASPTMSVSVSSSSLSSHGSLYQHLTNNQPGNQRASPLVQQGRSSPIAPNTSSLINDGHTSSNHTSVLQNMNNSGTGGVISSAGFHGPSINTTESSSTMLKIQYEKQPVSRVQAIQQEESSRRSRYVENIIYIK